MKNEDDGTGLPYPGVIRAGRVLVTPLTHLISQSPRPYRRHVGGPRWPDWDDAPESRYFLSAAPSDRLPPLRPAEMEDAVHQAGDWWWVGPLTPHFGHLTAEFASRLRPILDADPDARLVFALAFDSALADPWDRAEPLMRSILDWHGAIENEVLVVDRPMWFERLSTCRQPERVEPSARSAPAQALLSSLSRRMAAHGIGGPRAGVVYVSRTRIRGMIAGEAALEFALAQVGVRIVHPQDLSLPDQLATYAGAELIIFAEGSAVHGLQFGGADFGRVAVLMRRPDKRLIEHLLAPRCTQVRYLNAVKVLVHGDLPKRVPYRAGGLAILDADRVVDAFASLGIDLSGTLDPAALRDEADAALVSFAKSLDRRHFGLGFRSLRRIVRQIGRSGLPRRKQAALHAVSAWARHAWSRRFGRPS